MQKLNIGLASEFLVIASTLMQIKVRHLLPSISENEENEENDSLYQLKSKILEYQKYKEIGKLLLYRIIENSQIYYRPIAITNNQNFVLNVSVFDLAKSFYKVLKTFSCNIKEIAYQEIRVETKMSEILNILNGRQYVSFTDILCKQKTKMASVVYFMAVLELVKGRQISIKQSELFSEIRIYRTCNENVVAEI
ncbi:MAG: hypothetical protein Nk1A_1020 [Endomicrobiia bacterium]|nr:MAG: hypothetical protein Nk1A_1020 [Endomicrobiia bacterium]